MTVIDTVPVKRFYKVLGMTNTIMACIGIAGALLAYYLGVSQGSTDCKLEGTTAIIEQQEGDNEILQEEYNTFIDNEFLDYIMQF